MIGVVWLVAPFARRSLLSLSSKDRKDKASIESTRKLSHRGRGRFAWRAAASECLRDPLHGARRRAPRLQLPRVFALPMQVMQNLADHHRILDAGDDPRCSAAAIAVLNIDSEHPFEPLCPARAPGALPCPARCGKLRLRTFALSLTIKSSSSITICIVSSRYGVFS